MRALVTGGSGFIGTHMVAHLAHCGYEVINIDVAPPSQEVGMTSWRNCSILDPNRMQTIFREFRPQYVVHLAAYASMEAKSMEEFRANTDGTANVLNACKNSPDITRVIITSSQHVRRPGSGPPRSDTDFEPYMLYGQSKMLTEQLARDANLKSAWTIIRPTAVWGPGNRLLAEGLWKVMVRGKYFHPSRDPVVRSYGYVKNVVWQIERLLQEDPGTVNGRVFYVADGNIRQYEWINAFALKLTGRKVRTIPVSCLQFLAKVGDVMRAIGLHFPMYSSRYENLITPNSVPVESTLKLLGMPPIPMDEGVNETVAWLRAYYAN